MTPPWPREFCPKASHRTWSSSCNRDRKRAQRSIFTNLLYLLRWHDCDRSHDHIHESRLGAISVAGGIFFFALAYAVVGTLLAGYFGRRTPSHPGRHLRYIRDRARPVGDLWSPNSKTAGGRTTVPTANITVIFDGTGSYLSLAPWRPVRSCYGATDIRLWSCQWQ